MSRGVHLPLHPLLFAAAFVLQPAALNGVEPPGFVRSLLVSVAAAGVAVGIGRFATGNWTRAGMAATGLLVILVSRDPLLWILVLMRDSLGIGPAVIALGVLVTFAIWAVVLGVKARHSIPAAWLPWSTRALNIFGLVLVIGAIALGGSTTAGWLSQSDGSDRVEPTGDAVRPDIFVILLDGYPRSDVLEQEFGFPNDAFLADLAELGFEVDRASRSNYTYSALTFTSLFEVGYVRDESVATVHDGELRNRLDAALRTGPAVQSLHAAGYEIVGTAGGWEHDTFRGSVDRFLDRPELTDFERQTLQRTWLPDLPPIPPNLFFAELHRRVVGVLADAEQVAAQRRDHPAFVFVHVAAPHLPMAFAPDGGPMSLSSRVYGAGRPGEFGFTRAEYEAAYVASLEQLNREVLETIRTIRSGAAGRNAPEPAIVVMSDHGYITDNPVHGPEQLANLYAHSLPGAVLRPPGPTTPVNLVPTLLAAYVDGSDIERVPDRFFTTVLRGQELDLTEIAPPVY